jgi:hypothetical protein
MNYRTNSFYLHLPGMTTQNLGDFQDFKLRLEQVKRSNTKQTYNDYAIFQRANGTEILRYADFIFWLRCSVFPPQFRKVTHVMLAESTHLL